MPTGRGGVRNTEAGPKTVLLTSAHLMDARFSHSLFPAVPASTLHNPMNQFGIEIAVGDSYTGLYESVPAHVCVRCGGWRVRDVCQVCEPEKFGLSEPSLISHTIECSFDGCIACGPSAVVFVVALTANASFAEVAALQAALQAAFVEMEQVCTIECMYAQCCTVSLRL